MVAPDSRWLVWRVNNNLPTVLHMTEQDAMNEAERLATKHPSETFLIFKSYRYCRTAVPPVDWGIIT